MKKTFKYSLLCSAVLFISGCTYSAIALAQKLDERDARKQNEVYSKAAQQDVEKYAAMKTTGNPDGYYFMAIIFAKNKTGNAVTYAQEIKEHYEEAVRKGSNDAKIALGNMLVGGDSMPFEVYNGVLPWEERDIQRGLKLLSEAATKSCYYQQPLFMDKQCNNIRRFNAAGPIWVAYRDGVYARLPNTEKRTQVFPRDVLLADKWKKRYDQCEIEIKEYNKLHGCSNY